MDVCVGVPGHVHGCVRGRGCVRGCAWASAWVCAWVCACVCVCIGVCLGVCLGVCVWVCMGVCVGVGMGVGVSMGVCALNPEFPAFTLVTGCLHLNLCPPAGSLSPFPLNLNANCFPGTKDLHMLTFLS